MLIRLHRTLYDFTGFHIRMSMYCLPEIRLGRMGEIQSISFEKSGMLVYSFRTILGLGFTEMAICYVHKCL